MSFKRAFKCNKCPQTADKSGCPMWWEIIYENTNDPTQPPKVEKGCGYQMMPTILIESIKASSHTTDAAYDMRNKVISSVNQFLTKLPETTDHISVETQAETLRIEEDV